ncbi:hypothetical protein A1F94_010614 [Pyrenophora tritici-repentis]|nr:hypothetical protein PtrV1_11802 [Pyrenophora tritici-repentis]KAF7444596.1 hypothetical protein A1F99_111490 [Pyrenophora tritici-repentis]KAF7564745.1 hypothetical protein PtrM4_041790 [Pyrenophora tritici-repentis]KAG9378845.1 hypothetical protein A1F94_010614 [Pyrenophora tritici-repentis]KAI0578461.1 hypothetical protein Alg215_06343 [Pyrenophora tritici-repentis]
MRSEFGLLDKLRSNPVPPPAPAGWDGEKVVYPNWPSNKTVQSRSVKPGNCTEREIPLHERHGTRGTIQITGIITISVSKGFTVGNSVTFGARGELSPVPTIFTIGGNAEKQRQWSTVDTTAFIGPVPANKYGAFVTNAWTNRKTGHVFTSVIGGGGTWGPYMIDTLDEKQYGDMTWVDGLISICARTKIPPKRCLGGDFL